MSEKDQINESFQLKKDSLLDPLVAPEIENLEIIDLLGKGGLSLADDLKKNEKVFGHTDSEVADSLGELALCRAFQSHYSEAEHLFKESLQHRDSAKANQPDWEAVTFFDLAHFCYLPEERFAEAESSLKQALAIEQRTNGSSEIPSAAEY